MYLEVKLPELGEDAGDEATVTYLYFNSGDQVNEGDDFVEMATDKATFNVPAPASGKLKEYKVKEDDVVKVGEVLGILEVEG
jgi:pyruvate/2-oxoglutarate dehydrogenase complex dihydrolipoamide acyltransferase (E2) component